MIEAFKTIVALGVGGALVGIVLGARCLLWLRGQYVRDAQKTPFGEIVWRLPLIMTPVTKIPYALVVAMVIAVRKTAVPEWLPWAVGVVFAGVAILQGLVASALGNPDRSGWLVRAIDGFAARYSNSAVLVRRGLACKDVCSGMEMKPISSRLPLSMAVLGLIETLAVFAMVGTVVFLPRLAN